MLTTSYRDALAGRPPDATEVPLEKQRPVSTPTTLTKQKDLSPASEMLTTSYRDALAGQPPDATEVPLEKQRPVWTQKALTKQKDLSPASEGAISSSSASVSPSPASASNLQAEVLEEKENTFDSSNDSDPAGQDHEKSDIVAATVIDQESVDTVLKRKSKPGCNSRKENEKLMNLEPVNLLDDGKIKPERLGSKSSFPEESREEWKLMFMIRDVLSKYLQTERGKVVNALMKEELTKHPAVKSDMFYTITSNILFTKLLKLMILQAEHRNLKAKFSDPEWRKRRMFPRFENGTSEYMSWEENFDPEIVAPRLKIMKEVTKKVDPQLEIFMLCQCASRVNVIVHPEDDSQTVTEKAERKEFVVGGVDFGPAMFLMKSNSS